MRVKVASEIHKFEVKAKKVGLTMIISLPIAMADLRQYPGADCVVLAGVYSVDGKAVVIPATKRCGILVVDWSKFMRFVSRRKVERELYLSSLRNSLNA